MGLKKIVFELLPEAFQRRIIIQKTGFNLFENAKFTPTIETDIYTTPKLGSWKERLSVPYGHEPEVVKWFERYLRSDDVVFDVGAHMGYFAVLCNAIAANSEFHAFEANWFIATYLKKNKELHDKLNKWFIIEKFVGSENRKDFIAIDSYTQKAASPTVFLMDVDGEEINVLRGANELIAAASCTFLIEVHPVDLAKRNQAITELFEFFDEKTYKLAYLPNHRDLTANWCESIADGDKENEFFLLATPKNSPRL
jgi:hypothetical protein